jgi:hypothetical protein
MEDLDVLMRSNKLFARKFDLDVDPKVIEKLEELIGRKVPQTQ